MNDKLWDPSRARFQTRARILLHHLTLLKNLWTLGPMTEREVRTLWFYLFQLAGTGVALDYSDIIPGARGFLEWVQETVRQGSMRGEEFQQRLDQFLEIPRHLIAGQEMAPESSAQVVWGDRLVVVDNKPTLLWEKALRQHAVSIFTMPFSPTQVLRTARIMRPHMILLNAASPVRELESLCAVLRDDRRLDGTAVYLYVRAEQSELPAKLLRHIDGLITDYERSESMAAQILGILARVNQRRESSIWDPYTDLYSLAYLRERLEEEILRQQRQPTRLGIIALTWDPRSVHTMDEEPGRTYLIIRRLAEYLQSQIRRSDVVAYDGMGRFYLVLFEANRRVISERTKMIQQQIRTETDMGLGSLLTGMALAPDHGNVPEDLFTHADRALWDELEQATVPSSLSTLSP
ncbi:GGDEF domain-containing protein, diguanylate cyclase (c-di-GMP synthetase) or its enzymatically inactive variants [Sulfobacillus thermosulfidooxidans DSM 9293]|uniref:GGDEF domain-containing protein, diguanylate cyclase (C-di-GMP synthetase) or its enzymatically inactive variants n=1 Tax=Sulfobacillus thermosulfidooxidans (strain DSM 9293 / VKM B-1269 / AT-1) TaxID=929705 RepID=A0A1W1WBU5_SULTA|nr:diguanylate cyclase [Sulfobacillus thermosulfidooxidans]SMC03747.1 GGDEF domain-containing protein, diguanylate cyclase (c-di-GMP synthetase) or its enzymatically inactive variants [Sulfobacillus thermosulfidooxidans DSM 9293]